MLEIIAIYLKRSSIFLEISTFMHVCYSFRFYFLRFCNFKCVVLAHDAGCPLKTCNLNAVEKTRGEWKSQNPFVIESRKLGCEHFAIDSIPQTRLKK